MLAIVLAALLVISMATLLLLLRRERHRVLEDLAIKAAHKAVETALEQIAK